MGSKSQSAIYIGCSGWAYPSWKPDFYPAKTPAKNLLEYYATQLNFVEVNYTFRSLPSAQIIAGWLAAVGEDFRFTFKAPQRITHIQRLKNCADALVAFSQAIQPVIDAGRVGAVLFQLPPNFKINAERLALFLDDAKPIKLPLAFEFRHESWFSEEIYSVLRQHQACLCLAESDELVTPQMFTAPFSCYRLRKSEYSAADLERIREQLTERARTGDVYACFKHEEEPTGALRAVAMRTLLEHY